MVIDTVFPFRISRENMMTQITLFEELSSEIDVLDRTVHEAGELARSISGSGVSRERFSAFSKTIRFMDSSFRLVREQEEQTVFPVMEQYSKELPRTLLLEHKSISKLLRNVLQSVEDIEDGRIYSATLNDMLDGGERLFTALQKYILNQREELLPLTSKIFTGKEVKIKKKLFLRNPILKDKNVSTN